MALPKDKEPVTPEPPAGQEPAGRVEFDSRGNSVWRWAKDVLDSTSILLKRLDNKDLAIEPTQKVPVMRGGKPEKSDKANKADKKAARDKEPELSMAEPATRDTGGGFDPYNSRRQR
jgi:hypothetical protein